ncbi:MAG: MBL fold metallo-hydrolase [Deltaproteobacteria bacterium]|jgi:L-ascorbate metabolism protein UlaG (beta-lactamase superfamily)|nr:MBL fold metallo-hydrolase [Deltaproteobacteria bacterium]
MLWALAIVGVLALLLFGTGALFLRQQKFGALPTGERLKKIKASPHYWDGKFQNLIPTAMGGENESLLLSELKILFNPPPRRIPARPLPTARRQDLSELPDNSLIWFGHSAFLIKLGGQTFLFDPALTDRASPVPWTTKAFPGTTLYGPTDLPKIDYLLLSHDHWDHLDYPTVLELMKDPPPAFAPLGVGAHLEKWGYDPKLVTEGDWGEVFSPQKGVKITFIPARHFSGRSLTWNQSLWTGFVLEAGGKKIVYSGDSGYLPANVSKAHQFSPVDLAIVECGQYDHRWADIHQTPEQSVETALDFGAKAAMPVHSGKFKIANHAWDEPFIRFTAAAKIKSLRVVTPMIGEVVDLNDAQRTYKAWWEGLD